MIKPHGPIDQDSANSAIGLLIGVGAGTLVWTIVAYAMLRLV